jgi:subtilisin family serine protease
VVYEQGTERAVKVGIIDTGIDASHPDIAPNLDHRLSRNFTTDELVPSASPASRRR